MNDYPADWPAIAQRVKDAAGWRCVRCGHRAEKPGPGNREPCDRFCDLERHPEFWEQPQRISESTRSYLSGESLAQVMLLNGRQRVLTVHHLDGDKANCAWWNLPALCQVCHLSIQGRVVMQRAYMFGHSTWFQPYVAGYYAASFLYEDLTREQVEARLDELLALGRP